MANRLDFEPGSAVPLTRWNETTFTWEDVGLGVVTSDGQWVEAAIDHFTYYHYNGRLKDLGTGRVGSNAPGTNNDNQESGGCTTPQITQDTPAGRLINVSAQANSDVLIRSYINQTGVPPRRVEWKLTIEGVEKKIVFEGTPQKNYQDFMWDTKNGRGEKVPTGSYPFKVEVTDVFEPGYYEYRGKEIYIGEEVIFKYEFEDGVIVVHEADSPFGAGWTLNGIPQLHHDPDGYVLLTEGNGRGLLFTPGEGSSVYTNPEGDFSTLTKNADGTYTRRMKDGSLYNFSPAGLLTSKSDRNGNTTTYTYDQNNKLTAITNPYGQSTQLNYDGNGHLAGMTDYTGRTTLSNIDVDGKLLSVTKPEGAVTTYSYDADNLLTSRTDSLGECCQ